MANDQRAGDQRVRLRRHPLGYRLDLDGESYLVVRTTDGTLSSAVRWEVRREWDRAVLADFISLADVRQWASRHAPSGGDVSNQPTTSSHADVGPDHG